MIACAQSLGSEILIETLRKEVLYLLSHSFKCLWNLGFLEVILLYIPLLQASLPLAKLCAMVTMQKQGEANIQSFSLPLTVLAGDEMDGMRQDRVCDTGLLDVTVKYQQVTVSRRLKEGQTTQKEDDNQICLSLKVIQGCGLKVNGFWTS